MTETRWQRVSRLIQERKAVQLQRKQILGELRAQWDSLPEAVRSEVERRERAYDEFTENAAREFLAMANEVAKLLNITFSDEATYEDRVLICMAALDERDPLD